MESIYQLESVTARMEHFIAHWSPILECEQLEHRLLPVSILTSSFLTERPFCLGQLKISNKPAKNDHVIQNLPISI